MRHALDEECLVVVGFLKQLGARLRVAQLGALVGHEQVAELRQLEARQLPDALLLLLLRLVEELGHHVELTDVRGEEQLERGVARFRVACRASGRRGERAAHVVRDERAVNCVPDASMAKSIGVLPSSFFIKSTFLRRLLFESDSHTILACSKSPSSHALCRGVLPHSSSWSSVDSSSTSACFLRRVKRGMGGAGSAHARRGVWRCARAGGGGWRRRFAMLMGLPSATL